MKIGHTGSVSSLFKPSERFAANSVSFGDKNSSGTAKFNSDFSGKLQSVVNKQSIDAGKATASIVEKYDLRNISYVDLQTMAKELLEVGALKESQYLDFLPPSEEFASLDGSINLDWNQPKDYIKIIEDQIAFTKQYQPHLSTKFLEYQLELKQRFSPSK